MGGYFNDTYKDNLRPVLLDYITNTTRGQNVADIALSLVNRAQHNLWAKKPWCDLATDVSVILSANSYSFPADFGRIISIWGDLSGTGVPEYWYYEADIYERGYKLRDSFTKAAGHAWTITFHSAQSAAVNMIYQRLLDDFTGEGDEILFFPTNLMLLECQKIALREKGDLKELGATLTAFEEEFKDYCNAHQWVNYDPTPRLNDRNGNRIAVEQYTLDGSGAQPCSGLPNNVLP